MRGTIGPCKGLGRGGVRPLDGPSPAGKGPPSRVLIAYFSHPPIIEYLKRAFAARGVEARGFFSDGNNWFDRYVIRPINKTAHNLRIIPKDRFLFEDHPLCQLRYRNRRLLEEARAFGPDLVLIIRGYRYLPGTIAGLRRLCPVFGWWIEREEGAEEALAEAPLFDHYFFLHSAVAAEARKRGLSRTAYMHHSVDTTVFRPLGLGKRYDWCFVGGWSERRQRFLESAAAVSRNAALYGPRWAKRLRRGSPLRGLVRGSCIWGEDLVRLYNESRVVINHTNWGAGAARSGTTMRVLEGAACGAVVLTDPSEDLSSLVRPGEHVVIYEDAPGLGERLAGLLRDRGLREGISAAAVEHVRPRYSYARMVERVLGAWQALHGKAVSERADGGIGQGAEEARS